MELFSMEFISALAAIVVIDLVLAGDNAIVIALAARKLPRERQRQAVIWGAVGAIAVRVAMTVVVVWLLRIPGLLFVGGAMLVWIAWKLLLPEESGGNGNGAEPPAAATFWGAIRTIVVADTVMGLDNVLAVAGAAHGNYLLVVLGLLISVPLVIWGSTLLLRMVERYPGIVYFGSGVLAMTAAKMIVSEPLLRDAFAAYAVTIPLLYFVTVAGVLWAGFARNHHRLESRISARLTRLARPVTAKAAVADSVKGESTMARILVPVDGTANSLHAIRHIIREFRNNAAMEIHLINVQAPLSRHITRFVSRTNRADYHRDESEKALRSARKLLDDLGVPYAAHREVGNKAEVIAGMARRLHCDHIVMGTARKNSLTRMLESSVTNRVLELTSVPVEVIAGEAVSKAERYGIPAGIGIAVALLLAASD